MPSGMNAKPSPGSRLPSWASLLVLLVAFMGFLGGWGAVIFLAFGLDAGLLKHLQDVPQRVLDVYTIGLYLGLVVLMGLYWSRFEGRKWSDLGLAWDPGRLREGLTLGAGGLVTIYALSWLLGWVRFMPQAHWPLGIVLADLAAAACMGLAEEILFRGILLRTLLRDCRPFVAIASSAVMYAVAHFARPGLTLETSLLPFLGLTATGMLFAYAAYSLRTLWLSTGMHAVWILFIALSSQLNLWHYEPAGHAWTGSGYPPSGLLAALTMAGCAAILGFKRHGVAPGGRDLAGGLGPEADRKKAPEDVPAREDESGLTAGR